VVARIENPFRGDASAHRGGSRMALENIRERLQLFFDEEARLAAAVEGGRYRVEIDLPYRNAAGGAR